MPTKTLFSQEWYIIFLWLSLIITAIAISSYKRRSFYAESLRSLELEDKELFCEDIEISLSYIKK